MSPAHPPTRWRALAPSHLERLGHRLAAVVVVLVCVAFAVRGVSKALRPLGSDFTIYYEAAESALAREDPLTVDQYIYLPSFAVLIAPLALLPYPAAAVLWTTCSLVLLLFCAHRASRLAGEEVGRAPPLVAWLPLAALLRLADSNLANGQVNAFTLAMLLASFTSLRAGRDTAAGAWAGLAAAVKIVPAFVLLHFALRGRKRAALTGAAVAAGLVFLLPIPLLGWHGNVQGLGEWWEATGRPYTVGGDALVELRGRVPSQSLAASCYRLLCTLPATAAGAEGPTANLLDLPPDSVRWIVRALGAAHLLAFAWVVRTRSRHGRPSSVAEFGFTLCTALLLAPLLHKAHAIWVLVGVTALVAHLGSAAPWVRFSIPAVLLALGLGAIALTTPALVGRSAATWFLTYDSILVGLESIWFALFLVLRRTARA